MRARSLLALPLLAVVVATPATAAAPPLAKRIVAGVTAGGVDLSGLTALQAAQKLKTEATPGVQATPVVLGVAGKPFTLSGADAGLVVNGTKTAAAAIKLAAPGEVPLVTSYDDKAIARFVDGVSGKVGYPARNATLRITLKKMVVKRSKYGRGIDKAQATKLIEAALSTPGADRTLHMKVSRVRAAVTRDDLVKRNRTVLTVSKSEFKVRIFKNLKFSKSYGVATGQPAYPTPSGLFSIQSKQVNPTWSVPNSPWAGELQGTTVEGGSAANPLKARWMGIVNGVGFHGTGEDASIGTRASHGCLRMHVADVIDMYPRVPVGAPVLIK